MQKIVVVNVINKVFYFGISFVSTFLLLGCFSEVDCNVILEFTFKNNTPYTIETDMGTINPNSEISIKEENLGSCDAKSDDFIPPFLGDTKVFLNDKKCLVFLAGEKVGLGEGIVGIDNYESEKISNNHFLFTYTFTEDELSRAEVCN